MANLGRWIRRSATVANTASGDILRWIWRRATVAFVITEPVDWCVTDERLHAWAVTSASPHDWTASDTALHTWTMTDETAECD